MPYTRAEVRTALSRARAAGKDCTALHSDARDTEIVLEKWGFLGTDAEKIDKRVADWYVKNGLAARPETSDAHPSDQAVTAPAKVSATRRQQMSDKSDKSHKGVSTQAAMSAAEAALVAAQAALTLARALSDEASASLA